MIAELIAVLQGETCIGILGANGDGTYTGKVDNAGMVTVKSDGHTVELVEADPYADVWQYDYLFMSGYTCNMRDRATNLIEM